jgi:hypothetical protein
MTEKKRKEKKRKEKENISTLEFFKRERTRKFKINSNFTKVKH